MHEAARLYVAKVVEAHGPFRRTLELGSRDVNGSPRDLFDHPEQVYLGVDILPGPGVDIVADAAAYFGPHRFDCVVCCEVLEHTYRAPEIVVMAYKNLRPGGLLVATMATDPRAPHSAADGGQLRDREYYRNVTVEALETWLEVAGFGCWETDVIQLPSHGGDLRVVAWR